MQRSDHTHGRGHIVDQSDLLLKCHAKCGESNYYRFLAVPLPRQALCLYLLLLANLVAGGGGSKASSSEISSSLTSIAPLPFL